MKKIALVFVALSITAAMVSGCSTTAHLKIPEGSTLTVTDRQAAPDAKGEWKTSPFFWSSTSGADYVLKDKNGNVTKTGKLKTSFRVVSIFWPPFALIYWPMGFKGGEYDLTVPADGVFVTETSKASAGVSPAKVAPGHQDPAATPAKNTKKKKK